MKPTVSVGCHGVCLIQLGAELKDQLNPMSRCRELTGREGRGGRSLGCGVLGSKAGGRFKEQLCGVGEVFRGIETPELICRVRGSQSLDARELCELWARGTSSGPQPS